MCEYYQGLGVNRRLDQADSSGFFRDLTGNQLETLEQWFRKNRPVFETRMQKAGGFGQQQQQPQVSQQQQPQFGRQQPQVGQQQQPFGAQQQQPSWGRQQPQGGGGNIEDLFPALMEIARGLARDEEDLLRRNDDRLRRLYELRDMLGGQQGQGGVGQGKPQYQQQQRQPQFQEGQQFGSRQPQQQSFGQRSQPEYGQQPQYQQQQPWQQQQQQQPWQSGQSQQGGMLGGSRPWGQESGMRQQGQSGQQGQQGLGEDLYKLYMTEHGVNV
jgi:hypothetical protein